MIALERLGAEGGSTLIRGGPFVDASDQAGTTLPSVPPLGDPNRELRSTTTVATGAIPHTGISVPSRPRSAAGGPGARPPSGPAPADSVAPPPHTDPSLPAEGTYTYRLGGSETASLFGTRSYPETMAVVVHGAPDIGRDAVSVDYTFSPDHSERQVLARTDEGVVMRFEGGRVAFGLATQVSQADYEPPLLQIPASLEAGSRLAGSTAARAPDGTVSRTEDWSVTVGGREPVDVGELIVDAVVVDVHRQSRPGTADQLTRDRRYWFDPTRALPVRWRERFRGARTLGPLSFAYETDYTATLAALPQ